MTVIFPSPSVCKRVVNAKNDAFLFLLTLSTKLGPASDNSQLNQGFNGFHRFNLASIIVPFQETIFFNFLALLVLMLFFRLQGLNILMMSYRRATTGSCLPCLKASRGPAVLPASAAPSPKADVPV